MGADLYISALFNRQYGAWEPKLEKATAARDAAPAGTRERELAQALVEHCFKQLYAQGYFRDSYNPSNLLWKFGLSWWSDITPLLDEAGQLLPVDARHLLAVLRNREPRFESELAGMTAADQAAFRSRYEELKAFLSEAIRLNAPITASL